DHLNGRFDEAVRDAQRAVTTDPNYSWGYFFLALALNADGRPGDAVLAVQKAIRLDPAMGDFFARELGFDYLAMGRFPGAIVAFKRHAASYPTDFYSHVGLAIAYTELGRDQDARTEAAEVMRLNPRFTLVSPEKIGKDVAMAKRGNADLRKAGLK